MISIPSSMKNINKLKKPTPISIYQKSADTHRPNETPTPISYQDYHIHLAHQPSPPRPPRSIQIFPPSPPLP